MSDTAALELRVRLNRLAAAMSSARSERDHVQLAHELRCLRDSLDDLLAA